MSKRRLRARVYESARKKKTGRQEKCGKTQYEKKQRDPRPPFVLRLKVERLKIKKNKKMKVLTC